MGNDFKKWGRWLKKLHKSGEALQVMSPEDAAVVRQWRSEGKPVRIFRAGFDLKYSYTTSREKAEWFATNKYSPVDSPVRAFDIDPKDIIVYDNGRQEWEVLTLPEWVVDREVVKTETKSNSKSKTETAREGKETKMKQSKKSVSPVENKMLTADDVVKRYNISRRTFSRLQKERKIAYYKVGQKVVFDPDDVMESLKPR